jgi:hypothetical protein
MWLAVITGVAAFNDQKLSLISNKTHVAVQVLVGVPFSELCVL